MYEVAIKRSFSAAHTLKDIGGKCESLHGHNFIVEVTVASETINDEGLVVDFRLLKRWVDEILEGLDHKHLNDLPYFQDKNPSAENLARLIHELIADKAVSKGVSVGRVTIWESENARASYAVTRSGA